MVIKELNIADKLEWNYYLSLLNGTKKDIFYTPEYYELFEKNGDGQACCFVFCNDDKIALYPYLKVNINNKGYNLKKEYYDIEGAYGYNGVVYSSDDINFRKNFYANFTNFCRDNNIISEFTRFHTLIKNHNFSTGYLDLKINRETVYLDLKRNYDDIWDISYSSENRNMIRKARKNNLKVTIIPLNDIQLFYDLYQKTMLILNADDYYFFSINFFDNLKKLLDSRMIILGVYKEEKLIASSIILLWEVYAHYFLSAKNSLYKKYAAGNLMLDECIKILKEKNICLLNFGGGHSISGNDSLLKFKKNFSKELNDFFIGSRIINKEIYDEIIKQWKLMHPGLEDKYKNIVQKYKLFK